MLCTRYNKHNFGSLTKAFLPVDPPIFLIYLSAECPLRQQLLIVVVIRLPGNANFSIFYKLI